MNQILYKSVTVLYKVLTSAHFPLTIGFVDASQFKFIWNVFQLLFICLFTRSHKSSVLFLLLLCVVLVLYSYQESTLLWRPWIPLMKINLCLMNINSKVFISDVVLHFFLRVVQDFKKVHNLTWQNELMFDKYDSYKLITIIQIK